MAPHLILFGRQIRHPVVHDLVDSSRSNAQILTYSFWIFAGHPGGLNAIPDVRAIASSVSYEVVLCHIEAVCVGGPLEGIAVAQRAEAVVGPYLVYCV